MQKWRLMPPAKQQDAFKNLKKSARESAKAALGLGKKGTEVPPRVLPSTAFPALPPGARMVRQ